MGKTINNTIVFIIIIFIQPLFSQPEPDFTIIGLPDTQWYSEDADNSGGFGKGDIATFIAQTEWIVDNRAALNIVYVAHLGDCVQNGDTGNYFYPDSTPTNVDEWDRASSAMYLLEDDVTTGLPYGIPYGIAVGNHDQSDWGNPNGTTTLYNQYFGSAHFSGRSYYGGHYSTNNDNHYDLFSVGSLDFIVIYVEYGVWLDPDADVLDWANTLLSTTYSNRHAIVVSHKLLDGNSGLPVNPAPFNDPEGTTIFNALKDNPNLFLMLCGHYTREGRRTDYLVGGHIIHSLLSNYQGEDNGGDGWMRIMTFSPSLGTITVETFSPTRDGGAGEYKSGDNSDFVLNLPTPFPVELAFFTGSLNGNGIELRWRTETEVNNYGFDIERTKDNADWLTIGFAEGHGNSNSPKQYNFIDADINQSGTYFYRLKQIDNDGTYEYSDVVSIEVGVPNNFYLSQNYPNPFNPETRIDFTLPEKQLISLRIYNTLGELVRELVNEVKEAGSYSVTFDASNLPSGVYIYRLQTSSFSANKKMTLLK
jgi:hypothetical protein